MKKIVLILIMVVNALASKAQGIYNDGARIVGQGGASWVVSGGNFTFTSTNAAYPFTMDNLKIEAGASLTLPATTCLTVNSALTNNADSTGLVIKSNDSGTGSLKILGSVTGKATVERFMSIDNWHMVSSPTTSPIIYFLNRNKDIATSVEVKPFVFAMSGYVNNSWSSFFPNDKPITDLFDVGKGYRILTKSPPTQTFYFAGTLNSLPITNVAVVAGWNLIGNPYTSAININAVGSQFLSGNAGAFASSYDAAYFWDNGNSKYEVINLDFADTYAQVGQGFFVKAATAGTVAFNANMQVHKGTQDFKGAALPRPTINIIANSSAGNASSVIKFMEGAHEGLDIGYDAGIFKADAEFSVYTKLVADNGIEFQLQYLPTGQYDKMVIPVGIDSKSGGEIVFSVETVQLEAGCKVILEDKLTNTYTDLSNGSYKTTVVANTTGTGRFFLHTGDIVSGLEDQSLAVGKLTAYANGNKEIRVIGEVGEGEVATLVNGLGQVVLTKKLGAGNLNIIGLPNLRSGLYLMNINDKGTPQTIKVMIRK